MSPRRGIGSLIVENQALKADIAAMRAELDEAHLQQKAWADKWDLEQSRAAAAEAEVEKLTKALALAILATT